MNTVKNKDIILETITENIDYDSEFSYLVRLADKMGGQVEEDSKETKKECVLI